MESSDVVLKKRAFVGITVRVDDPAMASALIGALWDKLHREKIVDHVPDRLSDDFYGAYFDYKSNYREGYSLLAGFEVDPKSETPKGLTRVELPASNYKLYEAIGLFPDRMIEVWQDIWANDEKISRAYTVDLEHYGPKFLTQPPQVDIYIAVK
ncbi:MAG: hypothetical protein S4CHLAM81_05000 [Chlamydiales bacterium]|nr:hypothetical protein [Chlamydiales bacterium]MCH9635288.1 hypothetical protein [Chlamydiales bacterium]MCH9704246.1 GyrI-like domain-containing protein [Chlamydiota bacterium]